MNKKRDARRREALEIAFFILKHIDSPDDFEGGEDSPGEGGDPAEELGETLARGALDNDAEINRLARCLSPEWLLDKLDADARILLKLAFVCIIIEKMPPRVIIEQLIDLAEKKGRQLAFQTLYSLSFLPSSTLAEAKRVYSLCASNLEGEGEEPEGFAWRLVRGVFGNEKEINRLIEKYSHNWRLERMGAIERAILQIAFYELFFLGKKGKIVAGDALEMAERFGAGSAKKFIKGIIEARSRAIESGDAGE